MKGLICTKPGELNFITVEDPKPQPGHAIIQIKQVCVCGTDLHAFEGTQPYFDYPRILGHELSGILVSADQAPGFSPGDLVTIIPYLNCGHCLACRNGKPNCCVSIKVCGVHIDGGMVDYYSVPSYTLVHSQGLTQQELALVEPLAIGAHGIRRTAVQPGEFVLVIGAGPIGLGTMEFARISGAHVIAMDINTNRLEFAKNVLNIPFVINAQDNHIKEQLLEITNGDMPSVVIDATGSQKAINNGINYIGHGGRYTLIGLQKGDLIISHPEFHKRELTLMSSRNATRQDFDHVIGSIRNGSIRPTNYISRTIPFEQAKSAFENWATESSQIVKLAISL